MKIIKMKVTELQAPERNVRIHTEKQLEEFVRSINMFGQIRPVLVDENNVILAGNGLVMALKKAGVKMADVLKMDSLSENQKKKLMIADNKIFNLGIENLDTLNALLDELSDDLDIPGYDEEILKAMVSEAEEITEKISQYGILNENEIEGIKASKDRKEALIESASNKAESSLHEEPKGQEPEAKDIRKFVLCPKCGEKIWL